MVTAEFATALPTIVLALALACALLGFLMDEIRCVDAARASARAASRGESAKQVRVVASRLAPAHADVRVRGGSTVTVDVRAPESPLVAWLPGEWVAQAKATMPAELPGAAK